MLAGRDEFFLFPLAESARLNWPHGGEYKKIGGRGLEEIQTPRRRPLDPPNAFGNRLGTRL